MIFSRFMLILLSFFSVILITGGNSGIGAASAEFFAKEGAKLALVGRSAEKFEVLIQRIKENAIEMEPFVILADVSTDAERIIAETIEKYGRIDILINNAGFAVFDTLETMKMEDFDAQMNTNVRGMLELTQLAVPYLIESKGNIVNVASALAAISMPNAIAYAITKTMVEHFTKCLAITPSLCENGVRVSGFVNFFSILSSFIRSFEMVYTRLTY